MEKEERERNSAKELRKRNHEDGGKKVARGGNRPGRNSFCRFSRSIAQGYAK